MLLLLARNFLVIYFLVYSILILPSVHCRSELMCEEFWDEWRGELSPKKIR